MNKKFLSAILFGALTVASTGSFVSCKDYDDDINNLQTQIGQLANKQDLQSQVSTLQSAISTAQSAAENKAAAAQKAADEAKAAAEAAAAKAAAATTEAEKAAADAAAAKAAADAAAAADDLKAAEEAIAALKTSLEEVEALAATLVKTEDFEAAKKELNDKYAALEAKVAEATGSTGITGLQVISGNIHASYGIWGGLKDADGTPIAKWEGPKAAEVNAYVKDQYVTALGAKKIEVAVNPTTITDLTKTTWAVVNKYGETAPLVFSNPQVLTRSEANTYTLDAKLAVKDAAGVKEVEESFPVLGMSSALKAGLITSNFTNGFFTIGKGAKNSIATFSATVKYGEFTGSVELEAIAGSENFVDAYIKELKNVDLHDSLLFDLKHDGTLTLTYDKDAAKKLIGSSAKVFNVVVMQVNPFGYIHETTAAVTFEAKPGVDVVEKEVTLAEVEHTVKVYAKDNNNLDTRYEKISMDEVRKVLGYKEGSADSIHFSHSKIKSVEILEAYVEQAGDKGNLNMHVDANGKPDFATISKDDYSFTFNFAPDYNKTKFTAGTGNDAVDVLVNKTIKVVLKINTTDNKDLVGEVPYEYTVTVPLTFKFPTDDELYTWKAVKESNGTVLDFNSCITPKDNTVFEYVAGSYSKIGTNAYFSPSIEANLDLSTIESYQTTKNKISNAPVTSTATATTEANMIAYRSVANRNNALADLEARYMNYVAVGKKTGTTPNEVITVNSNFVKATSTVAKHWQWLSSATPAADPTSNDVINGVNVDETNLGENYSYAVKGLSGRMKTLDNRVITLDSRKIEVKADPTATMTTTAAKVGANTFLYNSTAAPLEAGNFAGSFTLKDKDGKTLNLAEVENTGLTVSKVEFIKADGTTALVATTTADDYVKMIVIDYTINEAGAKASGINVKVSEVEDAVKVKVTFNVANAKYNGTETAVTGGVNGVVAEFAL